MFGSTYQFRILRCRGLVGNISEHIKYVIDLTAPVESDEAVYLMTELCCSEGIGKWFLANQRLGVSKSLIGGEDDYMQSVQSCKLFTANVTEYSPTFGAIKAAPIVQVTWPQDAQYHQCIKARRRPRNQCGYPSTNRMSFVKEEVNILSELEKQESWRWEYERMKIKSPRASSHCLVL